MLCVMRTTTLSFLRDLVVQMVFSFVLVRYAGIPSMDQVRGDAFPLISFFIRISIGNITLGDIMEILPFEDPLVVLELDGEAIWAALESSLETWPSQEG